AAQADSRESLCARNTARGLARRGWLARRSIRRHARPPASFLLARARRHQPEAVVEILALARVTTLAVSRSAADLAGRSMGYAVAPRRRLRGEMGMRSRQSSSSWPRGHSARLALRRRDARSELGLDFIPPRPPPAATERRPPGRDWTGNSA